MTFGEDVLRLNSEEREVVEVLSSICGDSRACLMFRDADPEFLRYEIRDFDQARCDIQLSFGRGRSAGRFNSSLGKGAAFHVYEDIIQPVNRREIVFDIEKILLSNIECRRYKLRSKILAEDYLIESVRDDAGNPAIVRWSSSSLWPLFLCRESIVNYRPWRSI